MTATIHQQQHHIYKLERFGMLELISNFKIESVTTLEFLLFVIVAMVIYYALPHFLQWIELLIFSLAFCFVAGNPSAIKWMIISAGCAYVAGLISGWQNSKEKPKKWLMTIVSALAILTNAALWIILKGSDLYTQPNHWIARLNPNVGMLPVTSLAAAMGMGYYTLQVIGYILDCQWGSIKPQKNPLKMLLFVIFFPQLTTGPISQYSQLKSLYEKHRFSYERLCHGSQRILWGFVKKMVISGRCAMIVDTVWADQATYNGIWLWIALLLYPLQLYTDFSGCVDIVLGTAELFGIDLPENFNNPFSSETVQEFWQRWHITLGNWAKSYIFYPLLKSKGMQGIAKLTKKAFGKKVSKHVTSILGLAGLWLFMGLWHGNWRHVIGVSIWFWCLMVLSELLEPLFKKINKWLHIQTESFSWKLFRRIRTYILVAIGLIAFRAPDIPSGFVYLKSLKQIFTGGYNPWIIFDGSILAIMSHANLNVLYVGLFMLLIVAILRAKEGYARLWVDKQVLVFRWIIWLLLLAFVLVYGQYGSGYDAAAFIYAGF